MGPPLARLYHNEDSPTPPPGLGTFDTHILELECQGEKGVPVVLGVTGLLAEGGLPCPQLLLLAGCEDGDITRPFK